MILHYRGWDRELKKQMLGVNFGCLAINHPDTG
jgi:hypothetical protein